MSKRQEIEVVKINTPRPASRPKRFPRASRMYLELIENKEKVKPDLINKEYRPDPKAASKINSKAFNPSPSPPNQKSPSPDPSSIPTSPASSVRSDSTSSSIKSSSTDSSKSRHTRSPSNSSSYSSSSRSSSDSVEDSKISSKIKSMFKDDDNSSVSSGSSRASLKRSGEQEKFLERFREAETYKEKEFKNREYRNEYQSTMPTIPPMEGGQEPPSLAELEATGAIPVKRALRDIGQSSYSEQEEEDKKRELLFKFEILHKKYPTLNIPEFSIHSDYTTMLKNYEMCVRRISLDGNVENYKTILISCFMGMEWLLGSVFNLDMKGYTQQQILAMNKYEALLIEIGEESYVPGEQQWPAWVRLCFVIFMQTGMFIFGKVIQKKTGANTSNFMNMASNLANPPRPQTAPQSNPAPAGPKKKMRGPDIDLDELP